MFYLPETGQGLNSYLCLYLFVLVFVFVLYSVSSRSSGRYRLARDPFALQTLSMAGLIILVIMKIKSNNFNISTNINFLLPACVWNYFCQCLKGLSEQIKSLLLYTCRYYHQCYFQVSPTYPQIYVDCATAGYPGLVCWGATVNSRWLVTSLDNSPSPIQCLLANTSLTFPSA